MIFTIHPGSGVPIYRQLLDQLRQEIVSGRLGAGTQLPSVREVSVELQINMLTVVKAYQLIEQEGLVETRRGVGTFVSAGQATKSAGARRKMLEPSVELLVAEARRLGLGADEVRKMIDGEFRKGGKPE